MTRLWLPMGRRVLLLIAVLVFMVALLPMRLALGALDLDRSALSARGVGGSVWAATIDELRVAGVSVGSVDAALSPLDLLIGRARIVLTRPAGGAEPLSGAILVSRNTIGVADVTATLALGNMLAPLPIASLGANALSIRFVAGACVEAAGTATAQVAGSFAGIALNQGLTGTASCDGRHVRLPLASQSGQERLDLRIDADGGYIADLIAIEPDAARAAALAALGFTAIPGGYRLRTTGVIG